MDKATNYLYWWCRLLIEEAQSKGFNVYDLSEEKANRKDFDSHLISRPVHLVFMNGHGSPDKIAGHNNEPLLCSNDNERLISGKVIYARSCDAGKSLGYNLIKNGAKAFIGYTQKFYLAYLQEYVTKPLKDPLAKFFLEPSNIIVTALIKGNSAQVACDRSREVARRHLNYLISSASSSEERSIVPLLLANMKSQVVIGNPQATV